MKKHKKLKQYYKIRENQIRDLKTKLSRLENLDSEEVVVVGCAHSYQTQGKEVQHLVNLPNEIEGIDDNQAEETNESNEETDANEDESAESFESVSKNNSSHLMETGANEDTSSESVWDNLDKMKSPFPSSLQSLQCPPLRRRRVGLLGSPPPPPWDWPPGWGRGSKY